MVQAEKKTQKRKSLQRALMREKIIEKAAVLFEQRGYRGISVDDIADDVGISKPTFYTYLESKDQILHEIWDVIGVHARKLTRDMVASEDDATVKLQKILRAHLEVLAFKRHFMAVLFQHESEFPKRLQKKFRAAQSEYLKAIEHLFQQGIQEGLFPKIDPKIASLGLIGMCNSVVRWYSEDGPLTPTEIADVFFAMFTGLSSKDTSDPQRVSAVVLRETDEQVDAERHDHRTA